MNERNLDLIIFKSFVVTVLRKVKSYEEKNRFERKYGILGFEK